MRDSFHQIDVAGRQIASVFHPSCSDRLVVFCHGFRSSKIGPNRLFVRLARRLQQEGIASLRFDQYGSGDSEGDFIDSSFDDWIETTKTLVERHVHQGYEVALLGQSMGGAAVLAAAGDIGDAVSSVVAWVPDPSIDDPPVSTDPIEEGGQRVRSEFWQEAHQANIIQKFQTITAPTLIFSATNDKFVSDENRHALENARQANQTVEVLEGWTHGSWTYDQATYVMERSCSFLQSHFG